MLRSLVHSALLVSAIAAATDSALEISEDGTTFTELARLTDGAATASAPDRPIKAVRLRVLAPSREPLLLRELRAHHKNKTETGRGVPACASGDSITLNKRWAWRQQMIGAQAAGSLRQNRCFQIRTLRVYFLA